VEWFNLSRNKTVLFAFVFLRIINYCLGCSFKPVGSFDGCQAYNENFGELVECSWLSMISSWKEGLKNTSFNYIKDQLYTNRNLLRCKQWKFASRKTITTLLDLLNFHYKLSKWRNHLPRCPEKNFLFSYIFQNVPRK